MTSKSSDVPLRDALTAMRRIHRWLEGLRGEPLQPALNLEDRLDGLGVLGQRLLLEAVWAEAEDALAQGVSDVRRVWASWLELPQEGPTLRRLTAVLMRQWGEAASRRSDWERGRFWFEQSLSSWIVLQRAPLDVWKMSWPGAEWANDAVHKSLRAMLVARLLCAHGRLVLQAFDQGDWPRARMHWYVVNSGLDALSNVEIGVALVTRLATRLVAYSRTFEDAGVDRGGDGGGVALAMLEEGRELAPEQVILHRRCIEVGVRSALFQYALDEQEQFVRATAATSPSLMWCTDVANTASDEDGLFQQMLAEGWVCQAAIVEHPAEAVQALRQAIHLSPYHPTARDLLGQALAACAARNLGAGRVEAALLAGEEARSLLEPSPKLSRLWRAMMEERVRLKESPDVPVWNLDEDDDA